MKPSTSGENGRLNRAQTDALDLKRTNAVGPISPRKLSVVLLLVPDEVVDGFLNLLRLQGLRRLRIDGRLHRGGRDAEGVVGIPASMQNLHKKRKMVEFQPRKVRAISNKSFVLTHQLHKKSPKERGSTKTLDRPLGHPPRHRAG